MFKIIDFKKNIYIIRGLPYNPEYQGVVGRSFFLCFVLKMLYCSLNDGYKRDISTNFLKKKWFKIKLSGSINKKIIHINNQITHLNNLNI